jgi:hypothetical protein
MTAKIRKKCETESEKQKKLFFRFFPSVAEKVFNNAGTAARRMMSRPQGVAEVTVHVGFYWGLMKKSTGE